MPFYCHTNTRRACGLVIRAHGVVRERAVDVAVERIHGLIGRSGCAAIQANLAAAGAELHVIGEHQAVSDLPMYRHLAGLPFDGSTTIDERGRGYGGLHACCAEESLLQLPSARHTDHRDICSHELAHTILTYGLDRATRDLVDARYASIASSGLWGTAYAATNADELFAEATMWWVGSRGDFRSLPSPAPGPDWLSRHDPDTFALLDDIYRGRLAPALVCWLDLVPCAAERSLRGEIAVEIVFVNSTDEHLSIRWLSYEGIPVSYGTLAPESIRVLSTWASHVWEIRGEEASFGRYVAGQYPCRVICGRPL